MTRSRGPELPSQLRRQLGVSSSTKTRKPESGEGRPPKRRRIEEKPAAARSKPSTALQKLVEKNQPAQKSAPLRSGSKSQEEELEDREIAWLEASLGVKQSDKQWRKELEEDGLNDLFDDLDRIEADGDLGAASEYDAPSEEEAADEAEQDIVSHNEEAEDDGEEWLGISQDDAEHFTSKQKAVHFADGTKDLSAAALTGRYVPPQLRKAMVQDDAASSDVRGGHRLAFEDDMKDPRLKRILLGLLNKLSPANMPTILPEIEALYRSHPRAIVSAHVAELLMELVAGRDAVGETFISVYAVLVAALARVIGKELGAMVISKAVQVYDGAPVGFEQGESSGRPGPKQRINISAFFAELYNCRVVACTVIYDLVRSLVDAGLDENEVEMLLKILKTSGQQLRQDDPTALKQIIQLVNECQKRKPPASISSRSRFMIETLTDLKNNKVTSNNLSAADASVTLKRFLANLSKQRTVSIIEPLRLTLADVRASSAKGRWWLVGAAWTGDPLAEAHMNGEPIALSNEMTLHDASNQDEAWKRLAKKQGMNTEIRRNIFIALMGSEDYVDACERLAQLGLKEVQQREIVRVVLRCIGTEKAFNPFYVLAMQHLLARHPKMAHSYQITLQYALWDLMREMGEVTVGGSERIAADVGRTADFRTFSAGRARNIARAYAWWIAKGSLSLTIFKPVPFGALQAATTSFLTQLFVALLQYTQSSLPVAGNTHSAARRDLKSVQAVFEKAAAAGNRLSRGIRHLLETDVAAVIDEANRWTLEVADETLRLSDN